MIKKDTSDLKYKYLNGGVYGSCYLTPDRMVYKEFNRQVSEKIYDTITRLSGIELDSFVLPNTLIYGDNESRETLKGYLMRYSKGIDFDHIFKSTDMEKFITALLRLEKDIKELSKEKFQIYDLKGANVLYTKDDKIDVIDTDLYVHSPSIAQEDLLKCNLMELEYLLDTSFIKQNPKKFKSPRLLQLYENFSYGRLLGSYYIYEILNEIQKESKEEIKTYDQFDKGMSLIMKKH